MWIWKRLMKIGWTEHRLNQEVLEMVDENRSLMNTIRQRQKNWLGHALLCIVLEGRRRDKNSWESGRQSATMIDWMNSNDVEYEHIKKIACDRENWRY